MMRKPLQFKDLSVFYPNKNCFSHFSAFVSHGSRIAIIGRNGCGKSTLLKMINNELTPTAGEIIIPDEISIGYVPQMIEDLAHLSGAKRFITHLLQALRKNPDVLLLDEPTNHLDVSHRKSLIRMLQDYSGTLMIATHDIHLINSVTEIIWHINENAIHIFSGNYDNYMRERESERCSLGQEREQLNRKKVKMHGSLMKEQKRAKQSKIQGQNSIKNRKWPTIVSKSKASKACKTADKNRAKISQQKEKINLKLSNLKYQEIIVPTFMITGRNEGNKILISIREGQLGYDENDAILRKINLDIRSCERIAILGENASGKSSLIRGIMNDALVIRNGQWSTIERKDIGYLDQHYNDLDPEMNPFEEIKKTRLNWTSIEIRNYLSDFLFRKNEEVFLQTKYLSQGEKCKLSLAKLACQIPKLIILDEITNNLDLETKTHIVEVLRHFPAAMVIVSHDAHFLSEIGIEKRYEIKEGILFEHI